MTDAYEINRQLSGAYAVDAQTVIRLAGVIETAIGAAPKLKMEFENNRSVSSESVSDIDDSYVGTACLEEISLYAINDLNYCRLVLGPSFSKPVHIQIKLPRLQAKELESDICNILAAHEAWYHSFFKLKQTSFTFTTFLGLIAILVLALTIAFSFSDYIIRNPYVVNGYKGFLVFMVLNVISDLTLPSMSFDIGKSGQRIRLRRAIFGFLILVVLVGVAINLLSDVLKPYVLPATG